MRTLFFLIVLLFAQISYAEEYCRYYITDLNPALKVKVEQDENGFYSYNYSLRADADSKFPLGYFFIKFGGVLDGITAPDGWRVPPTRDKTQAGISPDKRFIRWSHNKRENMISPGRELSGFTITLPNKPTLTMAKVGTQGYGSPIIYSKVKKIAGKPCPGVWDEVTTNTEEYVRILTLGPASPDVVSLPTFIRQAGVRIWRGTYDESNNSLYPFSPYDKKDIEILIVSDGETNVKDLDIETLRFGRGEAKAKSVQKIIVEKQEFASVANDKATQGKDALLLRFNPKEVNPLCDVDLALFLSGKIKSGKNFFSGVAVKKTPCTEENWKIEAEKILTKENSIKQTHQ